ncbi:MAG: hypothetical protein FJ312_07520 [SAR202 cluster bacterium]|nr:hypothetical protein [SAR202 cluster bacterium]
MVVLRILHILFGVVWAGGAIFRALILEPRLRAAGPAVQGPAMRSIAPAIAMVLGIASAITIAADTTAAARFV